MTEGLYELEENCEEIALDNDGDDVDVPVGHSELCPSTDIVVSLVKFEARSKENRYFK